MVGFKQSREDQRPAGLRAEYSSKDRAYPASLLASDSWTHGKLTPADAR